MEMIYSSIVYMLRIVAAISYTLQACLVFKYQYNLWVLSRTLAVSRIEYLASCIVRCVSSTIDKSLPRGRPASVPPSGVNRPASTVGRHQRTGVTCKSGSNLV